MRFPISWIKEFADIPEDIEALARGFTFSGTEVDEVIQEDGEAVFDFGFTVNRPDLMNIFGLAREASSIFGLSRPVYTASAAAKGDPIEKSVSIEIKDADLCPRYRALLIRGAKVGESTPVIKKRLLSCGLRPINAVVDATNYVLLEYGHPLHAFDTSRIKENRIVIRRAVKGEKLLMLDGVERKLTEDMLVIADGARPLVVAGVMGGEEAGVTFLSRDILLEGAVFAPSSIRRTSKALNVHTDASHRYERGVDFEGPLLALEKAAGMILEMCGGTLASGCIDLVPAPPQKISVPFRAKRLNRILGMEVPEDNAVSILESLGFSVEKTGESEYLVGVPSFRVDVAREIDLIEEVVRIHGLDKLPSNLPGNIDPESGRNPSVEIEDEVKIRLASKGMSEAIHLSMTDPVLDALFAGGAEPVKIGNPLSEANSALRQSLLPNLLLTVRRNSSYGQKGLALFEAGHVYMKDGAGGVAEEGRLALVLSEAEPGRACSKAAPRDILALKGTIEFLFDSFNIPVEFRQDSPANEIFSRGHYLKIFADGRERGFISYLEPLRLQELDVRSRICAAEMDISAFSAKRPPSFKQFSRFPVSKRDLSLTVSKDKSWGQIEGAVRSLGIPELSRIELVEVYEDRKIGEDRKSVTLSLYFQSLDRTLSDYEVEDSMKNIISALKDSLGASLRQE